MKEIKEESNHNQSGFNDDSLISEDIKSKKNRISHFLIKSQLTDSLNNITKNNDSGSIIFFPLKNYFFKNQENYAKKVKSSINLEVIGNDNEIVTTNTVKKYEIIY